MPITLYRYIFWELMKLLLTAATVLTAVMSVAFAIMSITQGLLGPWAMVKLILYVLPGMLTIALPFAAALASTLVFFRMSQDNEIIACAVGGISYVAILMPVAIIGLSMTLGMFWFSNWVVPSFWKLAEQEVTSDAIQYAINRIQDREVIEWMAMGGRLMIYADAAEGNRPIDQTGKGPAPYNRIQFDGVAIADMDRDDRMLRVYTARHAVIDLFKGDNDSTVATMRLINVSVNEPERGRVANIGNAQIEGIEIPTQLKNRPQFMSLDELREYRDKPETHNEVRQVRYDLAKALAGEELLRRIHQRLEKDKTITFAGLTPTQTTRVTVGRAELVGDQIRLFPADGADSVEAIRNDGVIESRLVAAEAVIELADRSALDGEPRVNLILKQVTMYDRALPDGVAQRPELRIMTLSWKEKVFASLREQPVDDLVPPARHPDERIMRRLISRALEERRDLKREIESRLHERAATAVNAMLVLLLGAVMSMKLRDQTPLAIFFWCFMPTVVAFLTISSGQQMVGWDDSPLIVGLVTTWAGNTGLAAIILVVYWKLRRN